MSTEKNVSHTKGRLVAKNTNLMLEGGRFRMASNVTACGSSQGMMDDVQIACENTKRLAACWNACLGCSTESLVEGDKPQPGKDLSDCQIRTIMLANGFTIRDGLKDLRRYVYQAARALLQAQEVQRRHYFGAMPETAQLVEQIKELERLCDKTYVAQGADAYNHACEVLEQWQKKRIAQGKNPGCVGSLCGSMEWLYAEIHRLEGSADVSLTCDLCGKELDGETARHFSGLLDGLPSGHIHLCAEHAQGLPTVEVSAGVAAIPMGANSAPKNSVGEPSYKDSERMDFIEAQGSGAGWVARASYTGRGFRLHNSNGAEGLVTRATARQAIDQRAAEVCPCEGHCNGTGALCGKSDERDQTPPPALKMRDLGPDHPMVLAAIAMTDAHARHETAYPACQEIHERFPQLAPEQVLLLWVGVNAATKA